MNEIKDEACAIEIEIDPGYSKVSISRFRLGARAEWVPITSSHLIARDESR